MAVAMADWTQVADVDAWCLKSQSSCHLAMATTQRQGRATGLADEKWLFHLLLCCRQVGPRLKSDRERFSPNNILLMIAGGGLLWMGWAGFNGGAPYAANIAASVAMLNTNVSAATSLLTWTCLDVIFFNKPSVIGAVQGMMTGLVCITPGAGKPLVARLAPYYHPNPSSPVRPLPLRTSQKLMCLRVASSRAPRRHSADWASSIVWVVRASGIWLYLYYA